MEQGEGGGDGTGDGSRSEPYSCERSELGFCHVRVMEVRVEPQDLYK
jgi:hypothetical protein